MANGSVADLVLVADTDEVFGLRTQKDRLVAAVAAGFVVANADQNSMASITDERRFYPYEC